MLELLLVLFFLLFLFIGTPLFVLIAAISVVCFFIQGESPALIITDMYRLASQSILYTIPLFTFAGFLISESKAPRRIINVLRSLFGWMPAGLAIVAFIACALFTAFTGASGVTIIALGGLLYPILSQEGYSEKFNLGLLTTSGSLGLLFPPSIPLILYAIVASSSGAQAGVNVDHLFLSGVLPGILIIILLSLYAVKKSLSFKVQKTPFSFSNMGRALWEARWEIPLPILILVGYYSGWFTIREASAVAALYVFIVEVFLYRDVSIKRDLSRIIRESMMLVGGILVILASALALTNFLVDQEVPQKILQVIQAFIPNKILFLMALNIFLLIVGCVMDIYSAIIVVVPLIYPIAVQTYGIHPLHLGIIFLTNLEIGYATPPVGINLFIASFRFKKSIFDLYRASIPFLIILLLALMIITYVPDLSLVLLRILNIPY